MIVEKRTHYSRNSEREVDIDYILKNTSARRTDGVVKPDLHDATEGKRVHLFAVSQIYPTGYECETNYSWKIIMSWNIMFMCVREREREWKINCDDFNAAKIFFLPNYNFNSSILKNFL